jgi:hypothetical protein
MHLVGFYYTVLLRYVIINELILRLHFVSFMKHADYPKYIWNIITKSA